MPRQTLRASFEQGPEHVLMNASGAVNLKFIPALLNMPGTDGTKTILKSERTKKALTAIRLEPGQKK